MLDYTKLMNNTPIELLGIIFIRRSLAMAQKKLQAKDFITIGIFTAILWVVQMVIMYMGFLSPFIVAGYAVLIPIVTGIPMILYYARIEKFGMLTITSVIVALLLFIFGMGFYRSTDMHCSRTHCGLDCKIRQLQEPKKDGYQLRRIQSLGCCKLSSARAHRGQRDRKSVV